MKRYIILFAIFITAIFFYPVFAHAGKTGCDFTTNPMLSLVILGCMGGALFTLSGVAKRVIQNYFPI